MNSNNINIKFRGVPLNNKPNTFVYGNLYLFDSVRAYILSSADRSDGEIKILKQYEINIHTLGEFTGIKDKIGLDLYQDDIIEDEQGRSYRIYKIRGGFSIKAAYWSDIKTDLKKGDELIMQPMADAQTRSYIQEQCKLIGNYFNI